MPGCAGHEPKSRHKKNRNCPCRLKIIRSHTHDARGLDAYWAPPEATRALMAIEKLPLSILDPCCGNGAILDVLRRDHIVFGSDIVDYGWPGTEIYDYLAAPIKMNGAGIVTNPPYKLALKFIQKAIADDCQFHAWFLRTTSAGTFRIFVTHPFAMRAVAGTLPLRRIPTWALLVGRIGLRWCYRLRRKKSANAE